MNTRSPILVALVCLLALPAFATNGYFTHGQGTASKAMAGANTALAQEPLDSETNPASAAFIDRGYTVSLALFNPQRQYTVTGNPSGVPTTFGLTPGTVKSKSEYFPMPAFGINYRPTAKDAFGVNFVAHGGMNTDYRTNTFYGSSHTGVDLAQAFLVGTYARRITLNQSLGISAIFAGQRFKASGLEAFAPFSSDPDCLTGNGYEMSTGIGLRAGYLADILPNLSFGASYSPRLHMSSLKAYCGLFAKDGNFDIPTTANVGFAWKPVEPLTIALDYQRIEYAGVKSIANTLLPSLAISPLGTTNGAGFGWKNVNVAKLGFQWKASEMWTWRAGYSKCDQPIPQTEVLFNILAPGVIEQHLTAGGTKTLPGGGKFNFAVMYAPNKTVTGANPLEIPGQQTISLRMHEWEAEFGYTFGF
jgi:long-chain fatty acid transport protein